MGFNSQFALQQFSGPKCRNGSKATISASRRDVRYYPQSDRDSDLPRGRYVPIPTKVRRSKIRPSGPVPRGGCGARKNDFDFGERAQLCIDLD
jgi:hypothetical protein